MLATEEKKLRWMGIDFRSRWRRRAAVVLTYAGFFVILEVAIGDPRWAGHPYLRLVAMGALTFLLQAISVFRNGGLVKKFALPRLGVEPKHMVVGSLDEWARYRYGAPGFDAATDEQQKELLRTYHVGNYLVPAKPLEDCLLDERERAERDSTSRWVLGQLAWILALMTGSTAMQRRPFTPFEVAALLWIFFILAITLPQARILWIEPDPRDAAGPQLAAKSA